MRVGFVAEHSRRRFEKITMALDRLQPRRDSDEPRLGARSQFPRELLASLRARRDALLDAVSYNDDLLCLSMVVFENSLAYRFRVHEYPVRKPVNQPHTHCVNTSI